MTNERLYRIRVRCPECGWRPPKRVTEAMVRLSLKVPAGTVLETIQCQRVDPPCGKIYPVTAAAYQKAS